MREGELKEAKPNAGTKSYFDINQLELAYVHLALTGETARKPKFVNIGSNEKTLKTQKKNLMIVCKKLKMEYRKGSLVRELRKILSGERTLSIRCFAPL